MGKKVGGLYEWFVKIGERLKVTLLCCMNQRLQSGGIKQGCYQSFISMLYDPNGHHHAGGFRKLL